MVLQDSTEPLRTVAASRSSRTRSSLRSPRPYPSGKHVSIWVCRDNVGHPYSIARGSRPQLVTTTLPTVATGATGATGATEMLGLLGGRCRKADFELAVDGGMVRRQLDAEDLVQSLHFLGEED